MCGRGASKRLSSRISCCIENDMNLRPFGPEIGTSAMPASARLVAIDFFISYNLTRLLKSAHQRGAIA
jgi:hypothetical protein